MTTLYGGFETVDPEGFMQPRRYKVSFSCEKCGHQWHRTYKAVPKKNPACPNKSCSEASELEQLKRENENLKRMLESGEAPAQIGKNVRVKAVDETAKIVMEDFHMTDLKDGIRAGENMAPKLPQAQQAAADNYFGGGAMKSAGLNKKQTDLLGRRAIAGAFRNMAVPPNAALGLKKGENPFRLVRTEKLK